MEKAEPVKQWFRPTCFWTAQNAGFPVTLVDCDAEEPNVAEFISGELVNSYPVTQNIPVINTDHCVFCGKCLSYCNYNAIVYLTGQSIYSGSRRFVPRLWRLFGGL